MVVDFQVAYCLTIPTENFGVPKCPNNLASELWLFLCAAERKPEFHSPFVLLVI